MRQIKLKTKIMISMLSVILFLGLCMSVFGFFLIEKNIYKNAQDRVTKDLDVVRTFYDQQFNNMNLAFNLVEDTTDMGLMRKYLKLDYLYWIPADEKDKQLSQVAQKAFNSAQDIGGTIILNKDEIQGILGYVESISVLNTPKAKPNNKKMLDEVMCMEYAKPFVGKDGKVDKVLVGGKLLNRNFALVDNILAAVYEDGLYKGKPVGTITIFQDDVRIATNVLDDSGRRAIGTRVSEVVYDRVIGKSKRWLSKAFVVTDWYFTAYEPIKDINGEVIGILYVGLLEAPYLEAQKSFYLTLLLIILVTCVVSIIFSVFIAQTIAKPITKALKTTNRIAEGDLEVAVKSESNIQELHELILGIDHMARMIASRQENLDIANKKLEISNKNYLDLIGFVSHELKGILSSVVLNAYLLKKGILGQLNEKQLNTVKSMSRNLDYLTVTVKNFLNLSRIEKKELQMNKNELLIKEHIFDVTLEAFEQGIREKEMTVENLIPESLGAKADASLMQIVANNLISNAIKYGNAGGIIRLTGRAKNDIIEIDVYNDGHPIEETDIDKLFKKFSRVIYRGMEKTKGSGIGLYITKEILKMHGGIIKIEPRGKGNSFIIQIEKE